MCAATYLNSTDVESMAKQQFANGDIVLSLDPANTNAEDRPAGINALQTKNPLDEVLEETISDMDGVKNIEFIQGFPLLSRMVTAISLPKLESPKISTRPFHKD